MPTETIHMPLATRELAEEVANILYGEPGIDEIWLFGSVARAGTGNDLDLILVSDKETATMFQRILWRTLSPLVLFERDRSTYGKGMYARTRLDVADLLFSDGRGTLPTPILEAISKAHPVKLDIFIFPPNWRNQLPDLQTMFPNRDPHFMENVARDAILMKFQI